MDKVQLQMIHFDRFTDTLLMGYVCGVARMVHHAIRNAVEDLQNKDLVSRSNKFESRVRSFSNISSDSGGGD